MGKKITAIISWFRASYRWVEVRISRIWSWIVSILLISSIPFLLTYLVAGKPELTDPRVASKLLIFALLISLSTSKDALFRDSKFSNADKTVAWVLTFISGYIIIIYWQLQDAVINHPANTDEIIDLCKGVPRLALVIPFIAGMVQNGLHKVEE